MTSTGALTAYSGAKTGRSPLDKRVVKEPGSDKDVWWGPVNKPMSPEVSLQAHFLEHHAHSGFCGKLVLQPQCFVMDGKCSHVMESRPQHHVSILPICRSWFVEGFPAGRCAEMFFLAQRKNDTPQSLRTEAQ